MAYTAQSLIDEVRLRGMLPFSNSIGTQDSEILLNANAEMSATIVPLVMSVSEEFFVNTIDIPVVGNKSQYRLPDNNIGGRVRNASLIVGNVEQQLARLEPEELSRYVSGAVGIPQSFWVDGGGINLLPWPVGPATLRLRYYARPGRLTITAAEFSQIQSVAYNSQYTGFDFNFVGFGLTVPGTYDIIANRSPYDTLIQGASIVAGSPVFASSTNGMRFPQTVQNGDYVCLQDVSPVLQIPVEVQSLLMQLTLCSTLEQLGDRNRLGPAQEKAERLKLQALEVLTPRTDGNPQKMTGLLQGNNFVFGVR